jgi:acyl carrier protein
MNTSAADRLSRTIAQVFDIAPETISDETSQDAVASWDSFGHLNLVMALEDEFGITLSPEEAIAMRSVGEIRSVLRRAGAPV